MAQLGARFHGMEEVVGSIPTRSTKSLKTFSLMAAHCSKMSAAIVPLRRRLTRRPEVKHSFASLNLPSKRTVRLSPSNASSASMGWRVTTPIDDLEMSYPPNIGSEDEQAGRAQFQSSISAWKLRPGNRAARGSDS